MDVINWPYFQAEEKKKHIFWTIIYFNWILLQFWLKFYLAFAAWIYSSKLFYLVLFTFSYFCHVSWQDAEACGKNYTYTEEGFPATGYVNNCLDS